MSRLYSLSSSYRQVLFLEMVADAIVRVEAEADDDREAMAKRMRDSRAEHWGRKPWPGATDDPERFHQHVRSMASAFIVGTGPDGYPGRKQTGEIDLTRETKPAPKRKPKTDSWPADIRAVLDAEADRA